MTDEQFERLLKLTEENNNMLFNSGNYFQTKEQAEKVAKEAREVLKNIRMTRKRIKKVPVLDMFGGIYGYSAPEKEISIVVCDKSQADAIIVPHTIHIR